MSIMKLKFWKIFGRCSVQDHIYGCTGIGIWSVDPFLDEIHGVEEWSFICKACHQSLCDEI